MSAEEQSERPVLRIVRGTPSPDELAALVAVVAAAGSAPASRPRSSSTASGWSSHARTLRGPQPSGGWRASASPR